MDKSTLITAMSSILGVGGVTNILLVLCLAHTWRYWRQVKFYIILLVVGNFLDLGVTQGLSLAHMISQDTAIAGSTASCRFLSFMYTLGPSLSAMAIAAMSLHVLLTSITGNQGNRLRHALVLGLFVLLSLPMPLATIPLSVLTTYDSGYGREFSVCHYMADTMEDMTRLVIGQSVAMMFFPLFVALLCSVASGVLFCTASRVTVKGDDDKSDLILTSILGAVLLVFCAPYYIHQIVVHVSGLDDNALNTMFALGHVLKCFPFINALISIVFAYVHAFRSRGEFFVSSGGTSSASGERQKLVN